MTGSVAVQAQPSCLDPLFGRVSASLVPGLSIAEMIAQLLPDVPEALRARLRVTIGEHVILPGLWRSVRPKAGAQVLIRSVPGEEGLRTALTIAVTVGAIALGQFYAPILAPSLIVGSAGTQIAALAITSVAALAGSALINALVPLRSAGAGKPTYSIQGLKNQATPNGVLPMVLGRVRIAPPYAMLPVTEAIADQNYVTAAFVVGYGPVVMRGWRIGDTPIERYGDVTLETREGYAGDARLSLVPETIIQAPLTVELKTSIIPTGGPQIRTTAADASAFGIDINFPGGVFGTEKEGGYVTFTVDFTVRYRRSGDPSAPWVAAPGISVTAKKPVPITRSAYYPLPERGRYDVEVTRTTTDWDEADQSKKDVRRSGRSAWTALRSYRPEYPIAFEKPLALAACKIRATGQLSGVLDELNCEASSVCPDWDMATGTWIPRETSNPASLLRHVLQGPAIAYPLEDAEIAALQDWHAFCVAKGLAYNRYLTEDASVADVLAQIAAAGRATPRKGGSAWGVVIDRALTIVSAHITPRNSWGFKGERPYADFPDAFRVAFLDETNSYARAERVVPWPGFEGDPVVVQKIEMPGVTNPAQIWKETRRRQWELIKRADTFTVMQGMEQIAYERGDLVQVQHDVLDRAQVAARVVSVSKDGDIHLDELLTIEGGQLYACRFRRDDGSSLLCSAEVAVGETSAFRVNPAGGLPEVGNLALFGIATRESLACTVKAMEGVENFSARVELIPHAPEIEALIDAEIPPPWSGRSGADAQPSVGVPAAPLIAGIVSGRNAADQRSDANPYPVVVLVQAAGGELQPIARFDVRHRITGTEAWSQTSGAASAGAVLLAGYAKGANLDAQARAVSVAGTPGPWTATVTHTVAATDPAAPAKPQGLAATSPSAGVLNVTVTSGPSPQNAATQLYVASGSSAAFASATKLGGPLNGGPNVPLTFQATGLSAGTRRVWATALDSSMPPVESDPTDPVIVSVG